MRESKNDDIRQIADGISDLLPRFDADRLTIYLEELLVWNAQLGLISKQNTPQVATRLIRQCTDLLDFVVQETHLAAGPPWRIADIGTGAGFPGFIWKILAPDLQLTLIERKSRRVHFLERVAVRLGFEDVEVLEQDVRNVATQAGHLGAYDAAVMLAVAPPQSIGTSLERLLKPGGYFVNVRGTREKVVNYAVGESVELQASHVSNDGLFLLYRKRPCH